MTTLFDLFFLLSKYGASTCIKMRYKDYQKKIFFKRKSHIFSAYLVSQMNHDTLQKFKL